MCDSNKEAGASAAAAGDGTLDRVKPIVHYAGTVRFNLGGTDRAMVTFVLDHPRLGFQPVVYTSNVLIVDEDGKTFETRNTIYKAVDIPPSDPAPPPLSDNIDCPEELCSCA